MKHKIHWSAKGLRIASYVLWGLVAAVCSWPVEGGEAGVEAWARRYSHTVQSQDVAYQVVTDPEGSAVVAGYTDQGINGYDIQVIKYSSTGVPLWTNRYNGPANNIDEPYSVAVDASGKVFVTGRSYGGSGTAFDYVTLAYSGSGAPLWTNRFNGFANSDDSPARVMVAPNGNILVTGTSIGIGTSQDFATVAYSNAGTPLWTNRYNGPANGSDGAAAIAVDGNGRVFVAGYSQGNADEDYATVAYSSTGSLLWVNRYNGPENGNDYPMALAVDSNGNVVVTGYSGNAEGSNEDYATVAYSGTGTPLWTNRYDGPAHDYDDAFALAADAAGNIFVTGYSFDNTTRSDYVTIKYSSLGVPLWTNRYDGSVNGDDYAYAAAVDSTGNLFVTGASQGAGDSDYATIAYGTDGAVLWVNRYAEGREGYSVAVNNSGTVIVTGLSLVGASWDWATVAYSGVGVALWTNHYDGLGNNDDYPHAVAVDASGRVFATGASRGVSSSDDVATVAYSSSGAPLWTNRFSGLGFSSDEAFAVAVNGSGTVAVTGHSESKYLTLAYSTVGVPLWTNYYAGPSSFGSVARDIAVDAQENFFVTGYSQGPSGDDYATIKYTGAGVPLWTNRYDAPESGTDQAQAVAVDNNGNVLVTGYVQGAGNSDMATLKYSNAGAVLWTNSYDGPGQNDDKASDVAVDADGNVFVAGFSYGQESSEDFIALAYSSSGVALWTNRYNGSFNGEDRAEAVAVDGSGNVYVTGYARGTESDADYLTIKYSGAGVPLWTNVYNGPGNDSDQARAVVVDASGRVFVTGYSQGGPNSDTADFATIAYSSAGLPLWTNRYNAPFNGGDYPLTSRSMALSGDGSVVITGQSRGSYSAGILDFVTLKYLSVPELNIALTGTNTAIVSWPFPSTGYILQQNLNLNTATWTAPSETIASNGTNQFIIVNPPTGNRFFRLSKP